MSVISDTAQLVRRWREAGLPQEQAEKMVEALNEEIGENLATKQDIVLVRHDLDIAVRDLKLWIGKALIAHFVLLLTALGAIRFFIK